MANGAFIAQFGLRLANGVKPATGVIVESVKISEGHNRPSVWTYLLDASQFAAFNDSFKMLMMNPTPRINVRIGFNNGGSIVWDKWQEHIMLRPRAIPKMEAHTILLQTSDRFAEMNRETKITAWQGEIGDIVERIAKAHELTPVVEATQGNFSLIQSMSSDLEFLQRLIIRANTKDGRGGYWMFVRDDELHFHTPGYLSWQRPPTKVKALFTPTTKAVLSDDSQDMVHDGAAGVKIYTFNSASGMAKVVSSGEIKKKLAKNSPPLEEIPGGSLNFGMHIGQNTTDPTVMAQAMFESAHQSLYSIKLNLDGQVLHPNEIINVDMSQSSSQLSPWSGTYVVADAAHNIKQGAVTSSITAVRGEIN